MIVTGTGNNGSQPRHAGGILQQMIRGKQYALELTGATNEDGNALTAGSQIVVKHVAGVFLKCQ